MCMVLGIPYGSQEESIRIGRALALGFLNPPSIMHFFAQERLTKSLLVKSQGLKDLHQRLSLLTETSLPDSWTPHAPRPLRFRTTLLTSTAPNARPFLSSLEYLPAPPPVQFEACLLQEAQTQGEAGNNWRMSRLA